MVRFFGELTKTRIDIRKFTEALSSEFDDKIRESARAWLNAATVRIPAWSGASLGTFRKLADAASFSLNISPTPNGLRLGLGTAVGANESTGKITDNPKEGLWFFEYSTTLRHLIYNEFNNANIKPDPGLFSKLRHEGPYDFQEKGESAFNDVARTVRLPSVKLKKKTRTF